MYEAVLRAIKRTNGDAKNQNSAAVKKIDALDIGALAADDWMKAVVALGVGAAAPANARRGRGPGGMMPGGAPVPGGMMHGGRRDPAE